MQKILFKHRYFILVQVTSFQTNQLTDINMKAFLALAFLACASALSLPKFDPQAYLSGSTEQQLALDPSYASLVPAARGFKVDFDMDALQQAISEYESSILKQDRLNLAVDFDLSAFQQAYDEFVKELKEERFTFDTDAYLKMLEELAKAAKEALP